MLFCSITKLKIAESQENEVPILYYNIYIYILYLWILLEWFQRAQNHQLTLPPPGLGMLGVGASPHEDFAASRSSRLVPDEKLTDEQQM